MPTTTCPSRDELLAYTAGRLSEEDSEVLASHLDSCPQCQAGLVTLDDVGDTFVAQLRQPVDAVPTDPYLDESQCRVAVTKARAAMDQSQSTESIGSESVCGKVLGEYQLLEELGRGGMGTVYKALHTKLDRVVALKVLTLGRANDHRAIARFEREMKAVGKLDNPHIVRAHDAREIEGVPMLVMEYIEGLDLAEIVHRLGPMSAADACQVARQAALGLQYVHEHGLVHRDIKPSNLMLTPQGEIKILDLGLARFHFDQSMDEQAGGNSQAATGEMTGTDQAMGTADYMAPEQVTNSRNVDIRADIYSLGCTLYKLLSGRAPFSGPEYGDAMKKMAAHADHSPTPIRRFNSQAPEELTAILKRMMAKEPADRFPSPAEVAEALAEFTATADLPALVTRATSQSASFNKSVYGSAQQCKPTREMPSVAAASGRGRRIIWAAIIGLMFLGGMSWALGVLLRVERNGKTTEITVPEGSSAIVSENGQVDVKLPGTTRATASSATFIARLPQGTVELVAVTYYPINDKKWWAPDGSAATVDSLQPRNCKIPVRADEQRRTFLVRFKDIPDNASWPAWKLPSSTFWSGCAVFDADANVVPELKMLCASLPDLARKANLQVGVGMGPWDTVVWQKPDRAGESSFNLHGKQGTITFQQATAGEEPDSTQVALIYNIQYGEWNVRLIAIDKDGKTHTASQFGNSKADTLNTKAVFSGLPLSSVKEFQFQVRPYDWAEFHNVALNPGEKTPVAESKDMTISAQIKSLEKDASDGKSKNADNGKFHLVRGAVTWIGCAGMDAPVIYDDYDKNYWMEWPAHSVVLTKSPDLTAPGAIDLPVYRLLRQKFVLAELKLTDEQKKILQDISTKYWLERRKIAQNDMAELEAKRGKELSESHAKSVELMKMQNMESLPDFDTLPEEIKAKHKSEQAISNNNLLIKMTQEHGRVAAISLSMPGGSISSSGMTNIFSKQTIEKLEDQWAEARKQVEAVLSPEQLKILKDLSFQTYAFASGVVFDAKTVDKIRAQQKVELYELETKLRKELNQRLRQVVQEKNKKMLAVLSDQQMEKLKEMTKPSESREIDYGTYPYPALPYYQQNGAADELELSDAQRKQIRQILQTYWHNRGKLSAERQKLSIDDKAGLLTIQEKEQQLVPDVRRQIEAVMTPEQLASFKEMAFQNRIIPVLRTLKMQKNTAFQNWIIPVLRALGMQKNIDPSDQQQADLQQIEAEYFDKPEQIYREITEKALKAITPEQQAAARGEVDSLGW